MELQSMTTASRFKARTKRHIANNPDGRIVLINEANSRYLRSDDIASLWERSTGEKTIDEITTEIASQKNLSPSEIRVQVLESITQLITIGLVHPEESITLPLHT